MGQGPGRFPPLPGGAGCAAGVSRLHVHIWRWPPVPRNFPSCSPGGGPVTALPRGGGAGAARSLPRAAPMRAAPPPLLSALCLALAAAAGAAGRNRR